MTSKKLGALLRSVPPAIAAEAPETPEPVALPAAGPEVRKIGRAAGVAETEVPLQVLIPASIRRQLAVKAAEEGQSLRALVLRAIRSLGVTVTDADIRGKRGRHHINS
jgi:hypothetical protein